MATDTYVIIVPCPRDPMVPDAVGPFTAEDVEDAQARLAEAGISSSNDPPTVTVQLTTVEQVLRDREHDKQHHPELFAPKPPAVRRFYYHAKGYDNNGNCGPDPLGKGWRIVLGKDMEDARRKLPKKARQAIADAIFAYCEENDIEQIIPLDQFMEDTCGWGVGFTFMGDEDFTEEAYQASQESK